MMKLLLIRHGTTEANEAGIWNGHLESPISSKGMKELEGLKQALAHHKVTHSFVSPSKRTLETLKVALSTQENLEAISCEVVEALREIHFGRFEGKDFTWVNKHEPEEVKKMLEEKEAYCYPQGESLKDMHERVAKWLGDFMKKHTEGTYLICAHGGTLRSILSELLVHNVSLHWHFKIDPASLTVVTVEEGFAVIETLNKR